MIFIFFLKKIGKIPEFHLRALPRLLFYGVMYFLTGLFDLLSGFFYRLIDILAGFLELTLFRVTG
jgi:hypothetical protein